MQKIIVIGCPGAGKTLFANKLSAILSVPVHHLDNYFWKENWTPTPQDEFRKVQNDLMKGNRWIIDGNFTKSIDNRIAHADTIILFDFSKLVILSRVIKRFFEYFGRVRPDMGGNNKETLKWKHVKYIISFPRKEFYKKVVSLAKDKQVIVLRNQKEADVFFKSMHI